MPTVNNNFSSLITAIDTKAQSLAASTTNPKDLVFLGKTLEALNITGTVADVITQGDTQVARVTTEGTTQVAAVQAAGAGYATLASPTFTGTVNAADLTLSGNLTVNGTQTVINSATMTVDDLNITVADGAADAAAANGAGLTVDGAGATFSYASTGDKWTTNKGLDVGGTLQIDEVIETAAISATTSGTLTMDMVQQAVLFCNVNQTANRAINFQGDSSVNVDDMLAVGQSMSAAVLMAQGSTAYYLNSYSIDGNAVTPKWQGGSAPTAGNASGIDVYTFNIIKTASATFTVLASVAAFA
tara:strand:+ start:305 stop:1207 length:903 start_codon:yes stop_codon:yes gene_type:complete